MSNLTVPFDIGDKPGHEISIGLAAVACWRGGAAAIIAGVGYATPLVPATAGTQFIGVFQQSLDNSTGSAGGKAVNVKRTGIWPFNQSGIVQANVGQKAYFSDDNTVVLTSAGHVYAGIIKTIDSAGIAWVLIDDATNAAPGGGNGADIVAAGTALTNSTVETSLGSLSIAANNLKAGDRIRFRAQVIATATHSTDTLTVKAYLGGLSGTLLTATAALDVANSDIAYVEGEITVRTSGGSGTVVGAGVETIGTPGTSTVKAWNLASTALDTTAATSIAISGTWSVADAGNSCRLDVLSYDIIRS